MSAGLKNLQRELVIVQGAGVRRVGMLKDVYAEFVALDDKTKGRMERHFHNLGIANATMPKEHFNSEGRHPTGGNPSFNVLVQAFKSFQTRLYGTVITIDGVPTFVGTKLITDKKKTRADQKLLRRVAQDLRRYLEE